MSKNTSESQHDKCLADLGKWWFLNGGSLHGLWKRHQYTLIYHMALNLPKEAFKAGWAACLADSEAKYRRTLGQECPEGSLGPAETE